MLTAERYFSPEPSHKKIAQSLYESIARLPLICPHGHVDPKMLADPEYSLGTPVDLLIIPDHYIIRMLYSQGINPEKLGVPRRDGGWVEEDHRLIWQIFAENFYLFRGTPSGMWLSHELSEVFGVTEKLSGGSAERIYEQISARLAEDAFRPRKLFERFQIEVLCTTDSAIDSLESHTSIMESGWKGRVLPTFRPDGVVNLDAPGWRASIDMLSNLSGIDIHNYPTYIRALEDRREFFKQMGAVATDHAAETAYTEELNRGEADAIFQKALHGVLSGEDVVRFTGHMLNEMARMSIEDGLVMQLHPGSFRNHNPQIYAVFGHDKGADIPLSGEYTRNLRPLLSKYGNQRELTLILFTLDETTYSRELAPLAGHYPAVKLGPPWWFHDSFNGMRRYFDQVMETAGIYNTAGFNDDTRAFCSIPARHDLWRRASADWVGGLVVRGMVEMEEAQEMVQDLAYQLPKQAYKLDG